MQIKETSSNFRTGLAAMIIWAAATSSRHALADDSPTPYRLATFSVDVTIPLGHRCMGILPTKSRRIADPLYAHGFVLMGAGQPIVLCAVDWCEIRNGAYDQWRRALADAAGTSSERVLVCALHQHDAPVVDREAAELLESVGLANELYDVRFHDQTLARVVAALHGSLPSSRPVTHVGMGQARVVGIASSRRVVLPDGSVSFGRGSRSGADAFYRDQAEGEIDPCLKTLSFWNGEQPLLALHSYATHPMSYYGQGEVSADFVGQARDRRQRDDFAVRQIYVSGCSGDVTAGKYNDGSAQNRPLLAQRLYDAMLASWNATRRVPLERASLRSVPIELPFQTKATLSAEALQADLRNERLPVERRILAAMGLASRRRVEQNRPIDMPCLDLGQALVLLFPGESFVGYQLMAQRMAPDRFVLSIGYGECWPGYIPNEAAFDERFDDTWLWVDRGSEKRLRAAVERLVGARD
jgi:hypothetical protein